MDIPNTFTTLKKLKWKKRSTNSIYICGLPTEESLLNVSRDHLAKVSDVVSWIQEYCFRNDIELLNGFENAYRLIGLEKDIHLLYEETLTSLRKAGHIIAIGQLNYSEFLLTNLVGSVSWLLVDPITEGWVSTQNVFTLLNPYMTIYPEQDFFGVMYDIFSQLHKSGWDKEA